MTPAKRHVRLCVRAQKWVHQYKSGTMTLKIKYHCAAKLSHISLLHSTQPPHLLTAQKSSKSSSYIASTSPPLPKNIRLQTNCASSVVPVSPPSFSPAPPLLQYHLCFSQTSNLPSSTLRSQEP